MTLLRVCCILYILFRNLLLISYRSFSMDSWNNMVIGYLCLIFYQHECIFLKGIQDSIEVSRREERETNLYRLF